MHRTQGEDYKIESGKRRFASALPPTQKATRLPAEFMNAVQEEIAIVIENAGLTLSATASDDRTAGWGQLWDAITNHGIIGSNALALQAVTDGKIANSAVNTNNLKNSSVTSDKLASASVIDGKIASNAVNTANLKNGAVTSDKLGGTSVTYGKLGMECVDRTHFQFPQGWSRTNRLQNNSTINTTGNIAGLVVNLNQGYIGSSMLYRISVHAICSVYSQGYIRLFVVSETGEHIFDNANSTHRADLGFDLMNGTLVNGGITTSMSFTDIIQIAKGDITQIKVYAEFYNENGYGAPFLQSCTLTVEELLTSY